MEGIKLYGNWRAGWAIDLHTLSSIPLGNGLFDTTYTEIGKALNLLKYHYDLSQVPILVKMATEFLKTRLVTPYLDVILPVPPSNLNRDIQPVYLVAKHISKNLKINIDFNYIRKIKKTQPLKGIEDIEDREEILRNAFDVKDARYRMKKVLLFDDLYRSGATLEAITKVLYEKGRVQNVYVLTLTKTRSKR